MHRSFCVVFAAVCAMASADTLTVPGDYATIQEAINAAADGDVIELDRNRFIGDGNRDLDFLNKELTIQPSPGRVDVRIDAQGTTNTPHRPAFLVNQTKAITFIDLVFENGYSGVDVAVSPAGEGGGFLIEDSTNVVFRECDFRYSHVKRNRGGGVACFDSMVRFESCHFYDNSVASLGSGYGSNLFVQGGSVEVVGTTFERGGHTSLTSDKYIVRGRGAAFVGGTHRLEQCVIQDNPGQFDVSGEEGGGLYIQANVTVVDSIIRRNEATYDELAGNGEGGHGGGVSVRSGIATFVNCLFDDNIAERGEDVLDWPNVASGGALSVRDGGQATAINCTFAQNTIDHFTNLGILFAGPDSDLTMRNCIVYDNAGPALATFGNGDIDVEYSNVEGGAAGTGNIDADPLFGVDYALLPGSAGTDAGDSSAVPAGISTDLLGNPRFVDDPATADSGEGPAPIVDMGAYEFQPEPSDCDADLTGDGTLDFFDVQEFLNRYSAGDLSIDYTGDGVLNFFDVQEYLNLYAAGCP